MEWDSAVRTYVTALRTADKAPRTVASYQGDLAAFRAWLEANHPEVLADVQRLNQDHLGDFLDWARRGVKDGGAGLHTKTARRRRLVLRQFGAYMAERGWVPHNPLPPEHAIRERTSGDGDLPVYLTEDESREFLQAVWRGLPQDDTPRRRWMVARDRAVFGLLLGAGLRISELCGIDIVTIMQAHRSGKLRVLGKGNKVREVPLKASTLGVLEAYEAVRPPTATTTYFISARLSAITAREIQRRIKQYAEACRIYKPLTPHKLRHTFATQALANGANLREVQVLLGHADIYTTEIYTHIAQEQLRSAVDKLPDVIPQPPRD